MIDQTGGCRIVSADRGATMAKLRDCYNVEDFRAAALKRLPRPLFDYVEGGADDESTMAANTAAFDRYTLTPEVMRDIRTIDTKRKVLGCDLDWPVILAPTGMSRMFHPDGERGVAAAAADAGVAYSLSTMGSESIETIGRGSAGPKIYQLYLLADDALNFASIDRARAAGFTALCLTVDTMVPGNRERDLRSGLTIPPRLGLAGLTPFAARPRWCRDYLLGGRFSLPNVAGESDGKADISTLAAFFATRMERHISWDRVSRIARHWAGPFAIKGIQAAGDALTAIEAGATAVIVSNHGGRQLDGGAATFSLIGDIVDAVGTRGEVILDGGVRRGTHVVKAIAMGARAVTIGRPYVFALSAFGRAGVSRMLDLLREEFVRDMALVGCASVDGLSRRHLRPVDQWPAYLSQPAGEEPAHPARKWSS
jgi:L-lactate dehydrogenase (cytochrome)